MATPIIQKTGASSGASIGGQGSNDLVPGERVDLADLAVANSGATYFWEFEDTPIGTSPTMNDAATATPHFFVDADASLAGSYRIKATVNGVDSSVEVFAKPLTNTGSRIPSFQEQEQYDEGGNSLGWHEAMTIFMRLVDTALVSGSDASDSVKGITKLSVAAASPTNPIAVGDNDGRVPSQDENDALVGTSGTPSSSNRYVTDQDSRNTDTRDPNAHALGGSAHSADTLANLNSKVSDATLDDSSDPRDPNAHASSHEDGGADELTAQDLGSGAAAANQVMQTDGAGGWSLLASAVLSGSGNGAPLESADFESGSNQKASITDASQQGLDITGDLTLECWVKFETVDSFVSFLAKLDLGGTDDSYRMRKNSSTLELTISTDGSNNLTSSVSWSPAVNTWIHVAITREQSSGETHFYENGVEMSGSPKTLSAGSAIFDSGADFTLAGGYGQDLHFLDGIMAEARIWNVVRSADDILNHFRKKLAGTEVGLVGYWPLDSDLNDYSTQGNHLTGSGGGPTFVRQIPFGVGAELLTTVNGAVDIKDAIDPTPGQVLTAIDNASASWQDPPAAGEAPSSLYSSTFVRTNQDQWEITDAAQNGALEGMLDLSIEAWIRPASLGVNQIIASKIGTGTPNLFYRLRLSSSNHVEVLVSSNGTTTSTKTVTPATAFAVGQWRHVGFTRNGTTGDIQVYIDGQPEGTPLTGVTGTIGGGTVKFAIGGYDGASPNFSWDGELSEVRIWATERSAAEIANYYNRRISADTAGLAGYFPLDNDANDKTNNANNLSASGTPSFVQQVPFGPVASYLAKQASLKTAEEVVYLDEVQQYSKSHYSAITSLTDGSNVSIDAEASNIFELTATAGVGATRQLDNPSNLVAGMVFRVIFNQDGSGSRELTFDTQYDFGDAGAPSFSSQGADVSNVITCIALTNSQIAAVVSTGFA